MKDSIYNFDNLIKRYNKDTDSIWAYPPQKFNYELPVEGFKIHISATIQNAVEIFQRVERVLRREKVLYKVISSMKNLSLLNSGDFGYSQIGKFITVYPRNEQAFISLLETLYRVTIGFHAVNIPSDFKYKNSYVVYYRYGEILQTEDKSTDRRERKIPKGITVPVTDFYVERYEQLPPQYVPLICLRARGKSRVFQGINKDDKTAIIIKEGIMLGEVDSDGFDGANSIIQEKDILAELADVSAFPLLIDFFYVGNAFVVIEELRKGKTIKQLITDGEDTFIILHKNTILLQVLDVLVILNDRKICVGDLSPDNIILDDTGKISMIDVEYYRFYYQEDRNIPGTAGFWCENYMGKQAVIYAVISLWYYLSNPLTYRELLLAEDSTSKYVCNLQEYKKICSDIDNIINFSDYGTALDRLREAVEKEQ